MSEVIPIACYRRKRFATERAAESVVFKLRARGTEAIGSYKCEKCGQWHLGRVDKAA